MITKVPTPAEVTLAGRLQAVLTAGRRIVDEDGQSPAAACDAVLTLMAVELAQLRGSTEHGINGTRSGARGWHEIVAVEVYCTACGAPATGEDDPLLFDSRAEAVRFLTDPDGEDQSERVTTWEFDGARIICPRCRNLDGCLREGHRWGDWDAVRFAGMDYAGRQRECPRCSMLEADPPVPAVAKRTALYEPGMTVCRRTDGDRTELGSVTRTEPSTGMVYVAWPTAPDVEIPEANWDLVAIARPPASGQQVA